MKCLKYSYISENTFQNDPKSFLNAFTNSKSFGITKNNFFFPNFFEIYFVSNNNKINYIFLSLLNFLYIYFFI